MRIRGRKIGVLASLVMLCTVVACTVSYTFTGASIPAQAKTFSVEQIQNIATMVMPSLSSTLTDALKDKFSSQTRLDMVNSDGDLQFSGEITNYTSTPTAVTANEYAAQNRLTVTIKIRYKNRYQPEADFSKTFSAYEDYDSNSLLQTVEPTIIPMIVEKLVDDIFNASVSNWN